jgi:3-hydroxyisobutyrate dehydrogenase-like beta-hydroxyacid dehydrogenase
MTIRSVGILSTGDMGSGIGRTLRQGGFDVATSLEGRSALTRQLAAEAGIRDAGSLDALVSEVDLLISVLVPSEARGLAERVAASLRRGGASLVYADCNAIAPQTVRQIRDVIGSVGSAFVDVGIIGGPPRPGGDTLFAASGPDCGPFEELASAGLTVRVVGPEVGQASGLKMLYASSTKGTIALWTELLVAARALGLSDELQRVFEEGRSSIAGRVTGSIPGMPWRAGRWIGEMEEIAATFEGVGMTPRILLGAADMYRLVSETKLGGLSSRDPHPDLDAVLDELARHIEAGRGAGV